jgi:putative ABC transport system ATP-binding protein
VSYLIRNLKKSFTQADSQIEILKDINLSVTAGEKLAIVGRSGSGKSTLLSLMAGLMLPDDGEIIINQTAFTKLAESERVQFRAKNIGIVFQKFHLINHLTALENVKLALDILNIEDSYDKAKLMLEQVGLSHRVNHTPLKLSGGEAQRVAIARSLVTEGAIILADEPSGNLDHETAKQVMDLLFESCAKFNRTLILVTHDLELAKRTEKIYHLNEGVLN